MDFILGQRIKVIVYRGPSEVEADAVYVQLQTAYATKRPIPLNGTEFYISVEGAKKEHFADTPKPPFNQTTVYQITLRGVLVDGKNYKS